MMSKTSFCNGTILKKNLSRFWPVMAVYTLLCLILFPMASSSTDINEFNAWLISDVYNSIEGIFPTVNMLYAVICAGCVFGYLHNARTCNMMHAFPVTRKTLFCTNVLSGFLFFLLPWTIVSAVTAIQTATHFNVFRISVQVYLVAIMQYLFFYALAVFCMLIAGKRVFGVISYFLLNILVIFLEGLAVFTIGSYLYGINWDEPFLVAFSPFVYFLINPYVSFGEQLLCYAVDWAYLGIICAIAVGLLISAYVLYRCRRMETVGQTAAFKSVQLISQYVLTLLFSLCVGLILAGIMLQGEAGPWSTLILILFAGLIGHFLVKMLLKRTLRVFNIRAFIGYAAFALSLILMLLCFRYDWLNIVGYVPETDEVSSVRIDFNSDYGDYTAMWDLILTDSEQIDQFREIHTSIVENRDTADDFIVSRRDTETFSYYLDITYCLSNGEAVERRYRVSNMTSSEAQKGIFHQTNSFLNSEEVLLQYVECLNTEDATSFQLLNADANGYISGSQITELFEAIKLDIAEGTCPLILPMLSGDDSELIICMNFGDGVDYKFREIMVPEEARHTLNFCAQYMEPIEEEYGTG